MSSQAAGDAMLRVSAPRQLAQVALLELSGVALSVGFLRSENIILLLLLLVLGSVVIWWLKGGSELAASLLGAFRTQRVAAIILGLLLTAALPFLLGGNTYLLHILIMAQLYGVLAMALNFQLGSANIVNFATAASYGVGAYTSALLAVHFGISFWLGLPAAALVATLMGLLLGLPCMRTKDYYLALVTVAFGIVIHQLLNNLEWTGGPNGVIAIPPPVLFGHSFVEPLAVFGFELPYQANFYYLALALVGLTLITARRLHHSRVGMAWNAIRADEIAARCQGINVTRYKVLAFCVDAFLSALAGTIYAHYVGYISPDNFTFLVSVTIVTMVIVGGMDNAFGVLFAAVALTILPEKFRAFEDYRILAYGLIVIAMLYFRPEGLFPRRIRRYE